MSIPPSTPGLRPLGLARRLVELGPNERRARIAFHVALVVGVGTLVVGLAAAVSGVEVIVAALFGLALEWTLAFFANRTRLPGEAWRYGRRTIGVALFDTLVVLGLGLFHEQIAAVPGLELTEERPRLGVELDPADPGPGGLVARVAPGSPAEEVGLAAGDRIVALDGELVVDSDELIERVSAGTPGAERHIAVEREESTLELEVVPRIFEREPVAPRPLFEVAPEQGEQSASGASGLLAAIALTVLALLAAARRAPGAWLVAAVLVFVQLAWLMAGTGAAAVTAVLAGGFTGGGMLIGIAGGSLAGIAAALLSISVLRRRDVLPEREPIALGRGAVAYLLGAIYLVAITPRAGLVAAGASALLAGIGVETAPVDMNELFRDASLPPEGTWMLVGLIVLVAPLYEELLFRGLLQPWLARGLGTVGGIVASALVFGAMHGHYGPFALVTVGYGLVLGWARASTGSVLVPWLLHATVNVVASAGTWWPLVDGGG